MSGTRWQQIGAVCGLLFVGLVVATFFMPTTPDQDEPIASARQALADDRTGLLASFYVGGLGTIAFVGFVAALYGFLRRAEGELPGASVVALIGGALTGALLLIANVGFLTLAYAADDAGNDATIRTLLHLDNTLFVPLAFTLATFLGGVALSALASRSLPAWLGWPAAVLAVAFLVGVGGVFAEDEEGGALGIIFWLSTLASFLWVLATSVVMLRRTGERQSAGARRAASSPT